jgi:CheY-like chemotaxis protein
MERLIVKGQDAPRQPHLPSDVPVFQDGRLIGVKRRWSWSQSPLKPNNEFRVLVVNDMRDIADLCAWLLKSWGFQVWTAYDGLAGLNMARTLVPDLALLNYMMPGLDGLQVLGALRHDPKTARMKVIIDSVTPIDKQAVRLGAQDFLQAPFAPDDLLVKVSRVLRA